MKRLSTLTALVGSLVMAGAMGVACSHQRPTTADPASPATPAVHHHLGESTAMGPSDPNAELQLPQTKAPPIENVPTLSHAPTGPAPTNGTPAPTSAETAKPPSPSPTAPEVANPIPAQPAPVAPVPSPTPPPTTMPAPSMPPSMVPMNAEPMQLRMDAGTVPPTPSPRDGGAPPPPRDASPPPTPPTTPTPRLPARDGGIR
jgi:hypothetical protein